MIKFETEAEVIVGWAILVHVRLELTWNAGARE